MWALISLVFLLFHGSNGFTSVTFTPRSSVQLGAVSDDGVVVDRKVFINAALVTTLGTVIAPWARADEAVDDLSMPSEGEQKKAEEDAMKKKLEVKAELQKKASSKSAGFGDNLRQEREKQASLKMSKEERRIQLCEQLGGDVDWAIWFMTHGFGPNDITSNADGYRQCYSEIRVDRKHIGVEKLELPLEEKYHFISNVTNSDKTTLLRLISLISR
eukprot:CAMPEP_0172482730 /NCGR_PEP_ID=MMETSP1066-20121228/9315_1 /TAXON_ID=671091 /ORGANISM="Coscinodiscus wailesii, Strain CCMP2513" /LENGTH=215 /DNA_ID=CAMNT_0013246095 /DNA_START=123 /DNA_END=772 /DNA_ORIENTATION=-